MAKRTTVAILLVMTLWSVGAAGQAERQEPYIINQIGDSCGRRLTIHIGYGRDNEIRIVRGTATLGHKERVFLPDGIACDANGCSYQSRVTFTDFAEGSVIRTADDIHYLRLNIEHTYAGDLYINITCPNGQSADLMRYGGTGTSPCLSAISQEHRYWIGACVPTNTNFGDANTLDDRFHLCDSAQNPPGTGWNYCWSNNTTQGYEYAPMDGLIYRLGNTHSGALDSSDVAGRRQFYHPDDSFEELVGCPMNGDWYIEVMDGWNVDNGYIFEWELAMTPDLLSQRDTTGVVEETTLTGPWVRQVDDSTYIIEVPDTVGHDTTIAYTMTLHAPDGSTYDTTVTVSLHLPREEELYDTVCSSQLPYWWNGRRMTRTDTATAHGRTTAGCDSTTTMHLTVHPSKQEDDTVVSCGVYTWADGQTYDSSTTGPTVTYLTAAGCDSVIRLVLTRIWHKDTAISAIVCEGVCYKFGEREVSMSGRYTDSLVSQEGCDSVVVLELTVREKIEAHIEVEADCGQECYVLRARVDGERHRWWESGVVLTDSASVAERLTVRPERETQYGLTMRYATEPYCTERDSVVLMPIRRPEAAIEVIPARLSEEQLHYKAIDRSRQGMGRQWWVDGMEAGEALVLYGSGDLHHDSIEVTLVAKNGICSDTAVVVVPIDRGMLWVPNVFTPGLETNNRLVIAGYGIIECTVRIYDRNGLLVYKTDDYREAWDGTHDGVPCMQNAYAYRLRYRLASDPDKWQDQIGTVTLIR